jgi:deoxycytidine triphosphate deaminase
MHLLTNVHLEALIATNERLRVHPFERTMLQHTCYYLRLGERIDVRRGGRWERRQPGAAGKIVVEPRSFVRVWTLESIALSNDLFGVFGQVSDLIEGGLLLVHSPFIDPLFDGHLRLGLHNLTDEPAELIAGMPLAKVSIFDVTESRVPAPRKGSIMEGKLRAFRRYIEMSDISPFPPESLDEE